MCKDLVEWYLLDGHVCQDDVSTNHADQDRRRCDDLVLGSLVRAFGRVRIWPEPLAVKDIHDSVSSMSRKLRSLESAIIDDDHEGCTFAKEIDIRLSHIEKHVLPSGIPEANLRHMEEQAKV